MSDNRQPSGQNPFPKTKEEQALKENILKYHTLEGVISLSKDTFYGVGTTPCIAVFTAGEPHPSDKICKFINFENDGYRVAIPTVDCFNCSLLASCFRKSSFIRLLFPSPRKIIFVVAIVNIFGRSCYI